MRDGSCRDESPQSWTAAYLDGRTSARRAVTLLLSEQGITFHREDGQTRFWRYDDIRQTQGEHTGEPLRLECGAPLPEALVIDNPSFIPALRYYVEGRYQHFYFPIAISRRVSVLGAAFATSILAVGAIVLWVIPALADLMTPLVPIEWEVSLGQSALSQMVSDDQRCTNLELKKQLDLLMARLIDPSKSPYELHVTVVDSPLYNAYALPGGEIVIFRPLLQSTHSAEELAGVLAHEVQHVLLRHTTKSLLRDLSLAALIGAAFGDVTGIGALSIQAARTLSTLSYSRDMEEQADYEGVRLLQQAHLNPAGMVDFFEKLKSRERGIEIPGYLSTHPQTDERIAKLKTLLRLVPTSPPAVPDEEWQRMAAVCRSERS